MIIYCVKAKRKEFTYYPYDDEDIYCTTNSLDEAKKCKCELQQSGLVKVIIKRRKS